MQRFLISRERDWLVPLVVPVVAAASLVVAIASWKVAASPPSATVLVALLVLLGATATAEAFPVPIEGSAEAAASLAIVFVVAAGAVYGWALATLVACLAMALAQIGHRRSPIKTIYNTALYGVAAAAAGLVAVALQRGDLVTMVLGPLAGAATFWLINVALLAAVIGRARLEPPLHLLRRYLRRTAVPFAIMASLAAALVVLWERSPFLAAILLGPIVAMALYQRSVGGTLARLRELDRMKDEFIAVVSHELRTPLASVYGAAVTLRSRQLDENMQAEMLSIIHTQSERLAALLDEVLLANRLESEHEETRLPSCDPVDIAEEAVAAAQAQLAVSPSAARSVELHCDPALPAVAASADKLRRVLGNLIENAVKYSPEGGLIQVRLELAGDLLRVSVEDEGVGIPADKLDRIFEKFYRVDPNLTHGVSGTGLGLYICRTLVEQMNGRIWVVSEEGEGSTFTVELPLAESAQKRIGTPARPLIARAVDIARTRRPTASTLPRRSTTRSPSTGRAPPRAPSADRRRR